MSELVNVDPLVLLQGFGGALIATWLTVALLKNTLKTYFSITDDTDKSDLQYRRYALIINLIAIVAGLGWGEVTTLVFGDAAVALGQRIAAGAVTGLFSAAGAIGIYEIGDNSLKVLKK